MLVVVEKKCQKFFKKYFLLLQRFLISLNWIKLSVYLRKFFFARKKKQLFSTVCFFAKFQYFCPKCCRTRCKLFCLFFSLSFDILDFFSVHFWMFDFLKFQKKIVKNFSCSFCFSPDFAQFFLGPVFWQVFVYLSHAVLYFF